MVIAFWSRFETTRRPVEMIPTLDSFALVNVGGLLRGSGCSSLEASGVVCQSKTEFLCTFFHMMLFHYNCDLGTRQVRATNATMGAPPSRSSPSHAIEPGPCVPARPSGLA